MEDLACYWSVHIGQSIVSESGKCGDNKADIALLDSLFTQVNYSVYLEEFYTFLEIYVEI